MYPIAVKKQKKKALGMGYYGVNTENSIHLSEDLSNRVTMAKPKKNKKKGKRQKGQGNPNS